MLSKKIEMATETIIDLLRHGEPLGGSRYRGNRIDDPLTEKGWQQMWRGVGSEAPWDIIISSPLSRCADFARKLGEERGIEVEIVPGLKEIGFGDWEGKTKQELKLERPQEFAAFYLNPVQNTPSNAEPVNDFFARIRNTYETLLDEYAGKQVLIVAHAGVIRAAIAHAIGAPVHCMYNINVTNGGVSRVRYAGNRINLDFLNTAL